MSDYFYPEYRLQIGSYIITEGVRLELQLDTEISFDWIIITWTEKLIHAFTINKDDPIELRVGYNGSLETVFTGTVTYPQDLQVIGRNEMLKLSGTKIVNSFLQCTPEDVLTFVLSESGIAEHEIVSDMPVVKKLYNVSNMTAMEVIRDIDRFFQLSPATVVFNNKKFEWNVPPSQSGIVSFVYTENIISLENIREKLWELETVLIPGIRLLHKISVTHPKISGTGTIHRIKYLVDENGFVRLYLQFVEG